MRNEEFQCKKSFSKIKLITNPDLLTGTQQIIKPHMQRFKTREPSTGKSASEEFNSIDKQQHHSAIIED
jgi:hypothetical protein